MSFHFKNKNNTSIKEETSKKAPKKKSRAKKIWIGILTFFTVLLVTFSSLCLFSAEWMTSTWASLSFEELLYQLTMPLGGTESSLLKGFFLNGATPAIIIMLFAIVLLFRLRKKGTKKYVKYASWMIAASFAVFLTAGGIAWVFLDMTAYLSGTTEDFIAEKYVDPAQTEISFPSEKRNLIYIFMESMEMTYSGKENGGGFKQNCIPELTELALENETFSGEKGQLNGAISLPGATWTMGGLFAETSGLPLKISIGENQMNTQTEFFPSITTLGDVLEEEGYKNEYLLGSDVTFGGRQLYFSGHGNYDIKDIEYAYRFGWLPYGYHVFWGYEDYRLVEFAREELTELGNSGKPFNFTMLTVDTHFEDGYVCQDCPTDMDDRYANVMHCSSKKISSLVSWIQRQPWYENTTIVICGDHPTMDSDFCANVAPDYQRRVFTTIINSAAEKEYDESNGRVFSTFDLFPTTLAALGCEIEGNRLGLGTNLYSSTETYTELYGVGAESSKLNTKSEFMEELANIHESVNNATPPTASMEVTKIDNDRNVKVHLFNLNKQNHVILKASVKVYSGDDDSNAEWIETERFSNGTYDATFRLADYKVAGQPLHIKAYLVDSSDETYEVGEYTIED